MHPRWQIHISIPEVLNNRSYTISTKLILWMLHQVQIIQKKHRSSKVLLWRDTVQVIHVNLNADTRIKLKSHSTLNYEKINA